MFLSITHVNDAEQSECRLTVMSMELPLMKSKRQVLSCPLETFIFPAEHCNTGVLNRENVW
jgi:hypothetical protein